MDILRFDKLQISSDKGQRSLRLCNVVQDLVVVQIDRDETPNRLTRHLPYHHFKQARLTDLFIAEDIETC